MSYKCRKWNSMLRFDFSLDWIHICKICFPFFPIFSKTCTHWNHVKTDENVTKTLICVARRQSKSDRWQWVMRLTFTSSLMLFLYNQLNTWGIRTNSKTLISHMPPQKLINRWKSQRESGASDFRYFVAVKLYMWCIVKKL